MAKKTKALRALLQRPGLIVAPGVYDALSARICEMVRQVGSVANAVEIPVLGDADTGFGNAVNVYRTVQEYIRAGAAGLFIEDQVLPKRCGHMRGKQVI